MIDTLIKEVEKPAHLALYKIDEYKTYRDQVGVNKARNLDLNKEASKRSMSFKLNMSEKKEFGAGQKSKR